VEGAEGRATHPSYGLAPQSPNDIFGECNWAIWMKMYTDYVSVYAKTAYLGPTV